jgi:hypothetical protein
VHEDERLVEIDLELGDDSTLQSRSRLRASLKECAPPSTTSSPRTPASTSLWLLMASP